MLLFLFFFPNISSADVRIDEHTIPKLEHTIIPDPMTDVLPKKLPSLPSGHPLILPADGRISSLFGWRQDPITGGWRFHSGIDLANFRSSRVRASDSGRVIFTGHASGFGLMVVIKHKGGIETRYCHLDSVSVSKNELIRTGDLVGTVGMSGRTTGPHLHFEVLKNNVAIDPAPYLTF